MEGLLTIIMISFNLYSYFLLKGYEYPHEVKMTHLQHTYSRLNSKNSTAFPILHGLFGKDLNLDEEGQFILKPRYSALSPQQSKSSTFLQVPSEFQFQFCIKYQCTLTFSSLGEGHCTKQTQYKTICPRSSLRSLYSDSKSKLDFWENISFVPYSQHKLECQDAICIQVWVYIPFSH